MLIPEKVLEVRSISVLILTTSVEPETHKGLKRVTRVQCSGIFILTIFGHLSDGYPFSTKWLLRDHHADVLRQEFCISRLKIHRKRKFKRMLSFLFVEKGKLFIKKSSFEEFNLVFFTAEPMVCFEMQPSQRSFCWIFRYILHSMAKRITFLRGNLCILKCFVDVYKIFS